MSNIVLDGSRVRLVLRVPDEGIEKALDIPLRLPMEQLPKVAPEPLPTTRRHDEVELILREMRWRVAPMLQMNPNGTSITLKRIWGEPRFIVREKGQPRTLWKVSRYSIGGVYEPNDLDRVPDGMYKAGLFTCWRQPAYRLSVELRHSRTDKRVRFQFMAPPPPEAELKKLTTP